MTLDLILKSSIACVAVALVCQPVLADSTGFDAIHSKIRVGNKMCFDGHSHGGSGSGATRKLAEMQAIQSWYGYTAGEYGSDWANINKAIKRSMKCSGGGSNYNCDVEATACK